MLADELLGFADRSLGLAVLTLNLTPLEQLVVRVPLDIKLVQKVLW
jgi:hypothetical protein